MHGNSSSIGVEKYKNFLGENIAPDPAPTITYDTTPTTITRILVLLFPLL
jgi:hypothetical protein